MPQRVHGLTRWVAVRAEAKPKATQRWPTDPFALFDEWFAEARASEPNDPEAMALATADADGRPSVRMVLLKGHGPRRLRLLHQRQSRKGERARRQPARRLAVPLEVAAPPGADRRRGRARSRRPRPTPISPAASRDSQLGAWASDQSRPLDSRDDLRARFEEMRAGSTARTCRARRTGAATASSRADRILERPAAPAARTPPVHPRRRRRLDRRPALPMTDGQIAAERSADHARGAGEHRAWRCSCSSQDLGGLQTGSTAMLGSLADTALDLVASLITCSACASRPCRPTATTASATARPRRWPRWSRSILITISAIGIGWRAVDRLIDGAQTADAEIWHRRLARRDRADLRRCSPISARDRRTGSVAIGTDNVHYSSDLLLNGSVIVALVLDQYAAPRRRRRAVRHLSSPLWLLWGAWRASSDARRPADGPRMARGEAASASSPRPRHIPSSQGSTTSGPAAAAP